MGDPEGDLGVHVLRVSGDESAEVRDGVVELPEVALRHAEVVENLRVRGSLGEEPEEDRDREAVLGANAVSGHKLIEARLRHWISTHLAANLPKLVSGLDPTSGTLEVTLNGARTMSLFACHHPEGFWTPDQLASEFLANPPGPILRGEDVALVEIGPEGIRFHFCRVRGTDGQVAVSRGKAVGGGTPAAASESVLRAERLTVNDRNPVAVTD